MADDVKDKPVQKYFTDLAEGNREAHAFNSFTDRLKADFLRQIRSAVAGSETPRSGEKIVANVRTLMVLTDLAKAAGERHGAKLSHIFETIQPLQQRQVGNCFHEALVRVVNENKKPLRPDIFFHALADPALDPEVASSFREWVAFAQIRAFRDEGGAGPLSLNFSGADFDSLTRRRSLQRGMNLAAAAGHGPLIFEATEHDVWTEPRLAALTLLAASCDARIAVDDFAAYGASLNAEALRHFAKRVAQDRLIVKIDGALVSDFIAGKDESLVDRLLEIKEICPDATILAEWVRSPEEARTLIDKLKPHGLGEAIGLIQSRYLPEETPAEFLARLHPPDPSGPANQISF